MLKKLQLTRVSNRQKISAGISGGKLEIFWLLKKCSRIKNKTKKRKKKMLKKNKRKKKVHLSCGSKSNA